MGVTQRWCNDCFDSQNKNVLTCFGINRSFCWIPLKIHVCTFYMQFPVDSVLYVWSYIYMYFFANAATYLCGNPYRCGFVRKPISIILKIKFTYYYLVITRKDLVITKKALVIMKKRSRNYYKLSRNYERRSRNYEKRTS